MSAEEVSLDVGSPINAERVTSEETPLVQNAPNGQDGEMIEPSPAFYIPRRWMVTGLAFLGYSDCNGVSG